VKRLCWTGMAVMSMLFLLSACRLGREKTPSITVSFLQVKSGITVRVSGKDWRPGEQVVIGLNAPNALPKDSQPVSTALTDASGSFMAFFPFPGDERWAHVDEAWVVAHTRDFQKVAVAALSYVQLCTPTPAPVSTAPATPSTEPAIYVLGYVKDISASARIITVRPIEGQTEVIALVESTQIVYGGRPVQFQDLNTGDLIEANGPAGTNHKLIAKHIRILVRAAVEPTVAPTPTEPALTWRGEYYNNTTFSGNPTVVRSDPAIDFQWQDSAAAEGLPVDNFAVRWTGRWPSETGAYRFYAQVDDGIRVWLDAHLIIDQWHESTGALYSADVYLSPSAHVIKAEYFSARGSAQVKLWWEHQGPESVQMYPDWKGEYYSNMTLSNTPFLIVNERVLDFNWEAGIPASGMPGDNFSARWTRTVNLEEGIYRFYAHVDDGVRLWVDKTPLLDHWQDQAAQTYSGELFLPKGKHNLQVEYYEHTGQAVIKVWWESLPATPTLTSTPTQMPTSTATQAPTSTPTQMPTSTLAPTPTHTRLPPTDIPVLTPKVTPLVPRITAVVMSTPAPGSRFILYFRLASHPMQKDKALRPAAHKRLGGYTSGW